MGRIPKGTLILLLGTAGCGPDSVHLISPVVTPTVSPRILIIITPAWPPKDFDPLTPQTERLYCPVP